MHNKTRVQSVRKGLESVFQKAMVLSGPLGCGKTHAIKEAAEELGLIVEEIDTLEEYMEKRLDEKMVYLLRVSEIEKTSREYRGIVFETESPYLYKKIEGAVHVQMRKPTQKMIREVFAVYKKDKNSACKKSGISTPKISGNLHQASILVDTVEALQNEVKESFLEEERVSFYHVVGKILYHKTESIPDEVLETIEKMPYKTLMYIHENIPYFVPNISALAEILEGVSSALKKETGYLEGISVLHKIWKTKRHTPKKFYSIKSTSFYQERKR